jgi:peptide chain release factor 1
VLDRLDSLERELADLQARLADPAVTGDSRRLAPLARRYKELDAIVECGRSLRGAHDDLAAARELYAESDSADRDMLRGEIALYEERIAEFEDALKVLMLPRDPLDQKNVIVEIRGAEGGEEANLFARDLFEMYRGYCARMGWTVEVMEASESDLGGFASVIFLVKGESVWSRLKHEGGPKVGYTRVRPRCRCCPKPKRSMCTSTTAICKSMCTAHRGRAGSR